MNRVAAWRGMCFPFVGIPEESSLPARLVGDESRGQKVFNTRMSKLCWTSKMTNDHSSASSMTHWCKVGVRPKASGFGLVALGLRLLVCLSRCYRVPLPEPRT